LKAVWKRVEGRRLLLLKETLKSLLLLL